MTTTIAGCVGRNWTRLTAVLLATAMASTASAGSRERERERRERDRLPGLVDGSKFMDFANEDKTLIEVNIRAPLLKVLAKAVHHEDKHAAELLSQIEAVSAIVVTVEDGDGVRAQIGKITEQLEDKDWDHIARIKENDALVNVLALYDEEAILGLVVMVYEQGGQELVFANIAGRLDMALMASISAGLNIPGLEEIAGVDWNKHHRDHE